ncbi:MAG: hypothetical protein GF308_02435 [Candidatus Heimdallarchaeota archaeon]|nr:hypothetical protein [Candidatus Heimdallarchaeota archaeon]
MSSRRKAAPAETEEFLERDPEKIPMYVWNVLSVELADEMVFNEEAGTADSEWFKRRKKKLLQVGRAAALRDASEKAAMDVATAMRLAGVRSTEKSPREKLRERLE